VPRTASSPRAPSAATNGVPDHRDFGGNRATARVLLILSQFAGADDSHGDPFADIPPEELSPGFDPA
jgi:hypothetical protein